MLPPSVPDDPSCPGSARALKGRHLTIRYPNIIFAGGSVGKAPRESRSGVHVLEDDMHNLINGSV